MKTLQADLIVISTVLLVAYTYGLLIKSIAHHAFKILGF